MKMGDRMLKKIGLFIGLMLTLAVSQADQVRLIGDGGTGTTTTFTQGSIVFAGPTGAYTQNNTSLSWDNTNTRFGIQSNIANPLLFLLQVSSANAANTFGVLENGHIQIDQTVAPGTSANCAANTGSTDTAGSITLSGGATAACTITFAQPFAQTPFCTAIDQTNATATKALPSTTALVITIGVAANDTFSYICLSR